MASISAAGFSGNAALRFSRPTRCSGNQGPTVRIKAATKFASRTGSIRPIISRSDTAMAPTVASAARLSRNPTLRAIDIAVQNRTTILPHTRLCRRLTFVRIRPRAASMRQPPRSRYQLLRCDRRHNGLGVKRGNAALDRADDVTGIRTEMQVDRHQHDAVTQGARIGLGATGQGLPKRLARSRNLGDDPMGPLDRGEFVTQVPFGCLLGPPRTVEQGGEPIQAFGVDDGIEHALQHALVVPQDLTQRPRRLEVETVRTLVARTKDVVLGMEAALGV